jgi:hypothetical protein
MQGSFYEEISELQGSAINIEIDINESSFEDIHQKKVFK